MTQEKFIKVAESKANEYAKEIIGDYENHLDAVESVVCDFTEGALFAFNYLNK